jgi:hypothetical protein
MVAPAGIPGEDCVGLNVPEIVTPVRRVMEVEDRVMLIVDEPRKSAVSVCGAFIKTVKVGVAATFVPSKLQ